MLIVLSPSKTMDYVTPSKTRSYSIPSYLEKSAELVKVVNCMSTMAGYKWKDFQ